MPTIANSTYLDAYGNQLATAGQFTALASSTALANAQAVLGQLQGVSPSSITAADSSRTITVALTLNRANNPSGLLASDWSTRQAALADQNAVWARYGADPATFAAVSQALSGLVGSSALSAATAAGYLSSTADHTIWLTLNATQFSALFGTQLLSVPGSGLAWGGNLSLPDSIAASVKGIWIEQNSLISNPPPFATQGISLTAGPLGIGNATTSTVNATPTAIAAKYGFPLPAGTPTDAVALVENVVPSQAQLFAAINQYRTQYLSLEAYTAAQFKVVTGPDSSTATPNSELTLDVSVVAGAAPQSTQLLYAYAQGTPFKAYQLAFFDPDHAPVLSSSYAIFSQPTRGSPFQAAYQDLFIDGALRKVSVHIAAGDQGAAGYYSNGIPNVASSDSPTYALAVGGTSLATLNSAKADPTLSTLLGNALRNDPATLLSLTAAGLKTLPSSLPDVVAANPAAAVPALFETVWNSYQVTASNGVLQVSFGTNQQGSGGVVTGLATPTYQTQFGLAPTSVSGTGRGSPDVSALSFGDTTYAVLNNRYVTDPSASVVTPNGGTSAASPLWASLTTQLNAVFADQGLPKLGFYDDLLYQAAALLPASFNDITLGNNINSFFLTAANTGYYNPSAGSNMVPTGLGYTAGQGYDLASGLGTPNGLLLARALTAIAQAQTWSKSVAVMGGPSNSFSGASTISQTLLVQDELGAGTSTTLGVGSGRPVEATGGSPLAWTSRLAEQVLQKDFDPSLVMQLDGAPQGTITSVSFSPGQSILALTSITPLPLYQSNYTNSFGIVEFGDASGHVTLARPVSVAQTAGGAANQDAIVRLRQVTPETLKLELYKVDDFNGTIGGIAPGQAGYASAAAARGYVTNDGGAVIHGPGYGKYGEARIKGVNPGDIVAMRLTNASTGDSFWAFAAANETAGDGNVTHVRNYGLNTLGWESSNGGGDRDYNDLIVGIDFTSGAGHAWIA